jgi:hypothetical protein
MEYDAKHSGQVIQCPHCHKSLQLPSIPVALPISPGPIAKQDYEAAKNFKVIGALLMIVGVPGCFVASETNSNAFMAFGLFGFLLGMTLFVIGRFRE